MSRQVGERTREGVGVSVPRIDGIPKVKGQFAYGSDLWADEMLWGHTLRSPHPSARIRSIGIAEAVASPGVYGVLLADDVPGSRFYGLEFKDQPVLASDVVRYVGEPVALVAAEHPELARRAAEKIVVDYEPLPAVVDMRQALEPDAPQVHPFGNVLHEVRVEHGDPNAEAEIWVEGYYETGMQDQAPLGPEAGMAVPAEDGGIDLFVATQWLHIDRKQLAPCLNLPEDMVRLFLAGTGGAFGAREDVSMQIHACMLALHTGRPVKMAYGRAESFVGHVHRHPSRIWMRTGATRGGDLVNVRARILIDGGAYTSSSIAVISNATTFASGPYEIPNALIEGTCVFTNNPPCGAMRGFGAVQVCFAHEGQMDRLAQALEMDPVELRLRNAAATGTILPTGQVIRGAAPVREVIERCAAIAMPSQAPSGARDPVELPGGVAGNVGRGEGVRRGVGFAVGYKNHAYSGGFDDSSEARVTLSAGPEGPVAEVHCAAAEVGQGVHTILAQIARTVLGIERVILHTSDTLVGSAGSTSASRQTVVSGGAVKAACEAVLEDLFERARRDARLVASELGVEDGFVTADGERVAPVEELLPTPIECTRVWRHAPTHPLDERGQGDVHVGFLFGAQRAVVDVDEELGLVRVVQLATAQDVGFAINPQSVIGQIEGGSAQGLGLALMEEIQLRDGPDRERFVHRLPAPDHARHAEGRGRARRGARARDAVRRQGRGRALERGRAGGDRLGASERARARPPTHPGPPRRPGRPSRTARHPAVAPVPRTTLARAVARRRGHPSDGGAVTPGRWPPRRLRSVAIGSAFLVLLAGCTSDGEESAATAGATGATSSSGSSAPEPMRLEVLVDNVEYGGDAGTDAVIDAIDADVVGVLESYNRLPEIAANTGYPYYDVSLQLLSKYPIHEPSGAEGRYALIEVRPGEVVAFFNIHLDYVKYGPKLLRNGQPVKDVLASEDEVRTSALDEPLRLMDGLIAQGYPVIFTGDHNEPSSLDWTEATVAARNDVPEAVRWPVSEAILGLGFRDTYREVHPDPVEDPGITHEIAGDRIDYVYAAGPIDTLDSQLVGEEGGPDVEIGFKPWTSDHRAVLSTFDVTPVPMPVMVSVSEALLTQGDPLTVAYRSSGSDGTVAIVPSEGGTGSAALTEDGFGDFGQLRGRHGRARTRWVRRGPDEFGRGRARARRALDPRSERRDPGLDRSPELPRGGADRRELDRWPGQPLGLDRGLPGGEVRPEGRLLPDLELRRPARGRCRPALGRGLDDPGRDRHGQPLAAAPG